MSKSHPAIRMGFQAKVLVPVLALLVILPALTLLIVTHHIGEQMEAEANATLTTADGVFRQSVAIRQRSLIARFRNAVNEPRFRAVAGLGDVPTMSAFLGEALVEFGEETEFLAFTNQNGDPAGGTSRSAPALLEAFNRAVRAPAQRALEGEIVTGCIVLNHEIYDLIAVPVFSADRRALNGVLTVAVQFGEQTLRELRSLTHTEIVVIARDQVTTATLPHMEQATGLADLIKAPGADVPRNGRLPVIVAGEHFLALRGELQSQGSDTGFHYLLLSSYEARLRALAATRTKLIGLSLLGVVLGAIVISVVIRRVTRPLLILRDGAETVGRGDFSIRIDESPDDECGELARAFNRMIRNLDSSRTELERTVGALRATDAQLRESREQLRLMIESAHDHMILSFDARGSVISWNPAAGRLLGYTADEAQGMGYGLLFSPEDRTKGVPGQALQAASSDGRYAFEGWRIRKDGTRFWADVTLSPLPDQTGQGIGGFVEIARDISVRKEAELALGNARDAAERANRAKTEFLANMSHELRTPMNAIIGMASLLEDRLSSPEDAECARTIRSSAGGLLGLIDDILDYSKIESGQIQLAPHACELLACVDSVIDQFTDRCAERGLALGAFLSPGVPAVIMADERRLRQILTTLVDNAVKFTEVGGVTLTVDCVQDKGRCHLKLVIEDTGIGIARDQIDLLFKQFSQIDSAASRRYGGLGLGLAICHHLVDLMGGSISVHSTPGSGSRFSVEIPIPPPLEFTNEFQFASGKRIAVSGDGDFLQSAIEAQLRAWGAHVETLENGIEGFLRSKSAAMPYPNQILVQIVTARKMRPALPLQPGWEERIGDNFGALIRVLPCGVDPFPVSTTSRSFTLKRAIRPRTLAATLKAAFASLSPSPSTLAVRTSPTRDDAQGPQRILLVEDNPVNARVTLLLLKRLNRTAVWVTNGQLALDQLTTDSFDLILMDLQMPVLDGLEATRRFRLQVPASQPPFICALTANALPEDRAACMEIGMHHFMPKPVRLETLAELMETAGRWLTKTGTHASGPPTKVSAAS